MKLTPEQEQKWNEWAAEDGDAWDRKELGADAAHARRAPAELEAEIDQSLHRKRMIAIRLPQSLIDALKELAAADSIGYQTYIRQVLARHIRERGNVPSR
jgi:predicted DNA binding CopG/RHH family protein